MVDGARDRGALADYEPKDDQSPGPGIRRLTWAFVIGTGDGNRTRAVSLGSVRITAGKAADLHVRAVVSDRD